jgi:hypothetical protein
MIDLVAYQARLAEYPAEAEKYKESGKEYLLAEWSRLLRGMYSWNG